MSKTGGISMARMPKLRVATGSKQMRKPRIVEAGLIAKRRWRRRRLIGLRDAAFSTLRPKLVSDLLWCGLLRFHSPFLTHYEALKDTEQQSKLTVLLIARTLPFLTWFLARGLRSHVLRALNFRL